MVLQLRALIPPQSIICDEDGGKECVELICLVSIPVCEATILIL